jgi:hypothetical protein
MSNEPQFDTLRNRAIVQAVIDHASPHAPVSQEIQHFCEYLLTSPLRGESENV